jgi:hypothetical protein
LHSRLERVNESWEECTYMNITVKVKLSLYQAEDGLEGL